MVAQSSRENGHRYPPTPPLTLVQAEEKRQQVVGAFQHAWKGYARDAFGRDEYMPLSGTGRDWAPGGVGLMITDALDTMLLMNLTEEYNQARTWVETKLDFDKENIVNVFEMTIRVLGGLLSAYHLSGNDTVYLEKAADLGNRLVGAFDTPSGIPYANVILSTGLPYTYYVPSSTAEATTVQLEFKYLSHLTGEAKYQIAAERVMQQMDILIERGSTLDGLAPIYISPATGEFVTSEIRLGSRGDSYYEYLLKQYLHTNKRERHYRDMYDYAIDGVKRHLLARSHPNHLLYIAELLHGDSSDQHPKMDHLVCFIGASLALGATEGAPLETASMKMSKRDRDDLELGKEITRTCHEMYEMTATGLASEIVYFNEDNEDWPDMLIKPLDRHNLLRPETLESLFVLWRITGDEVYREWGWKIFEAFEEHTKIPTGGYAALADVTMVPPPKSDHMDTFFLAETLKYLYLMFSPNNVIPLERYVLNTEAHPFPIL